MPRDNVRYKVTANAGTAMPPQQAWEYKSLLVETKGFLFRGVVDVSLLDRSLNTLGDLGWELVAVVPISDGSVGTARLLCTLKRAREESG